MDYEKKYKEALEKVRGLSALPTDKAMLEEIFPDLKESKDERIRKAISYAICAAVHQDGTLINDVTKDEALAYLEKQKEHQNNSDAPNESSWEGTISSSDNGRNLDELAREYIDGVKQYHPTPTWDLMQTAVCYGYHLKEEVGSECVESVKPAEWSEEDEMRLKEALEVLNESIKYLPMEYGYTKDVMLVTDWLKSLRPQQKQKRHLDMKDQWCCNAAWAAVRDSDAYNGEEKQFILDFLQRCKPQPHWKPSEEQIEALENATALNDEQGAHLYSLLCDLKKQM